MMEPASTAQQAGLAVAWVRRAEGWLADNLAPALAAPPSPLAPRIEARAADTHGLGPRPLWEGYADHNAGTRYAGKMARTSNQVRTSPPFGNAYAALVARRRPAAVVEFGTAFGVSGMYWLAGLEAAGHGHLFTFEPNDDWSAIAQGNLATISSRFTLTHGTFEANAARVLSPGTVDIAFIDAIHTSAFVFAQFAVLKPFLTPSAIVLFDDIGFSADMTQCWNTIAQGDGIRASATVGRRAGIVEMDGTAP